MEDRVRGGTDRRSKGRAGEQAAAFFLSHNGYRVLARNQRTPLGELDIVCRSKTAIVIVEVKARSNSRHGEALEAIGPKKARRLRAAAVWWLSDKGLLPCAVRFDVVTVALGVNGEPLSLRHFENILCG